jgi:hypothetical protein
MDMGGEDVARPVEALCYKPEAAGSNLDEVSEFVLISVISPAAL